MENQNYKRNVLNELERIQRHIKTLKNNDDIYQNIQILKENLEKIAK